MIYIKRLCFALISLVCMLLAILGTFTLLITAPIWGIIYYIGTGEDPINDEIFCLWEYSTQFLQWYDKKFGPNDYRDLL